MPHNDETIISRRRMLGSAAVLGAAAGIPLGTAQAATPIERTGKPHLKLSLAGYSFNRLMPRRAPISEAKPMTLLDFVRFCADHNCDACEPTAYYFPETITHEYLMELKGMAFRLGLDISGTAIGNDFCVANEERLEQEKAQCREWIDYAALMGAPVIRIFAGKAPRGVTEAAARAQCIAAINECLEHAAQKGVVLALENHGGLTATPEQLLAIVEGVDGSPWFGVNFDSGNFKTDDPYGDLARIAPYAVNAQLKVSIVRQGQRERADFRRIAGILRDAGYRGYVALEYEEDEDPRLAIPPLLDELRELIAA